MLRNIISVLFGNLTVNVCSPLSHSISHSVETLDIERKFAFACGKMDTFLSRSWKKSALFVSKLT
jgi:hypothetical protein